MQGTIRLRDPSLRSTSTAIPRLTCAGSTTMRLAVALLVGAAPSPATRSPAWTIAQAIRCVNETFIPRSLSAALSALRLASRVSTGRVRNEVAVGIERLSFIALASIAAGPRSGLASPAAPRRAGAAPAPSPSAAASTSSLVTLPPGPEPSTDAEVDALRGGDPARHGRGPAVARRRPALGAGSPCAASLLRLAGPPRRARGAAPAAISASACPTCTVSSGSTRSLVIVPAAGAGTSASILSVETSITVSPSSTCWPSATCHSSTVPSVTDSPISGIEIDQRLARLAAPAADGSASARGGRPRRAAATRRRPSRRRGPRRPRRRPSRGRSVSCSGDASALGAVARARCRWDRSGRAPGRPRPCRRAGRGSW